ncbi:hypothetical protein [Helicobacter cetorum]|uniref:hypothetical protein n=1 Tax=Helicobacter cetorum TaxID=138563 RepID=UPI0002FACC5C|nr:hypothetical protein [Helicobacter cetorum]
MLQAHPQYRVKSCPSDTKGFPIDIAVFEEENGNKQLKIVVECKKKDRKENFEVHYWFNAKYLHY